MGKYLFLLSVLVLQTVFVVGQDKEATIDSLRKELRTAIDTHKVDVLVELANELKGDDEFLAKEHLQEAKQISEWKKYHKGKAKSLLVLGEITQSGGNTEAAIKYYSIADSIAKANDLLLIQAEVANNLGKINNYQGKYPQAIEMFGKSIALHKKTDNLEGVSLATNRLAYTYLNSGNSEKAEKLLKENLERDLANNFKPEIANNYNILGILEKRRQNYAAARTYFEKSMEIKKELGSKQGVATCINNIGVIYGSEGDYNKAIEYYLRALEIYKEVKNTRSICIALDNIGTNYRKLGNYEKAIDYGNQALEIAQQLDELGRMANITRDLATAYKEQGSYEKAYEKLWRYNVLQDSLREINNSKAVADASIKNDVEIKEAKIKALEKENESYNLLIDNLKNHRMWLAISAFSLLLLAIVMIISKKRK